MHIDSSLFLFTVRSRIVMASRPWSSGGCWPVRLAVAAARRGFCQAVWLPGSARDAGRDDTRGVPVQAPAGPVVPDRGPRVSVGGSLLNVAQRHAGVQIGRERL